MTTYSSKQQRHVQFVQQLLTPLQSQADFHGHWGIGGSTLLLELGLQDECNDLDLVCCADAFPMLFNELAQAYRSLYSAPHPQYCSQYFARFSHSSGFCIELMANIAVRKQDQISRWCFEPQQVQWRHGLPWMSATQWLELYQLFNRPKQVQQLKDYLILLSRDPAE